MIDIIKVINKIIVFNFFVVWIWTYCKLNVPVMPWSKRFTSVYSTGLDNNWTVISIPDSLAAQTITLEFWICLVLVSTFCAIFFSLLNPLLLNVIYLIHNQWLLFSTECFENNLFDQLIINYANESVQQFCLKSIVKEDSLLNCFEHEDVIGNVLRSLTFWYSEQSRIFFFLHRLDW